MPTGAGHPGSFGHTGFTGTSLWLDPTSDTYVILLANAIHPRGAPPISALRGQVATAAAKALGLTAPVYLSTRNPGAPSFEPHPKGGVSSEARSLSYDPAHPCAPPVLCDTFGAPPVTTKPGAPGLASETWVHRVAYDPSSTTTTQTRQALKEELKRNYKHWVDTDASRILSDLELAAYQRGKVLTGIDVLEQTHYAALKTLATKHNNHLRIALLTNQSGLDATGKRTIDLLLHADPTLELREIFTPEHGLLGKQDTEHLQKEEDPTTHLPVISLYGAKNSDRHPKQSDLKQIDVVVIDLQDAGVRFWTYTSVLGYFLEAAAQAHIEVVVLDRPNPVGGVAFGGPVSDPGTEFYANFMPTPVRYGMTFGELARYYNAYAKQVDLDPTLLDARAVVVGSPSSTDTPTATQPGLHASLTVVPMQNWRRADYYEDTGVPWLPPSPNLRTPRAAVLYPAIGLIETTNISVGRGTQTPFENIAAPWIDAAALTAYIISRHIPGVTVTPTTLTIAETPEHYPSHGQTIPGIHFEVTDPTRFDSPEFGIELLAALHHLYSKEFQLEKVNTLLRNAETLSALKSNHDPRDIAQTWQPALKLFAAQRAQVLLY